MAPPAKGAAPRMKKSSDKPIKETDNPKMLVKKHNDKKLAIIILIVWNELLLIIFGSP